ncbi:MAG: FAD-dependent oxidoreductase [Candidatus Omnitrophota bacterium]
MKKVVILGNSMAAIKTVELIKPQIEDCQIFLAPLSDHLSVEKQRYIDMIDHQLKSKQIYYKTKEFYEKNNIKIINEKKVTRVNVSRKKIHFEDRTQLDFDILILCDTPDHRYGDLKGTNKVGVFGFRNIKDIEQISTLAALNDTIAIEADQWWGLELSMLFSTKKKEVILSISANHPLLQGAPEEYKEWVTAKLKSKGISLLINNPINEILGEGDLKAIKTRSGKVYATDLVILENTHLDTRVFNEALEISQESIVVDDQYKTNIEDVYAVDVAAQRSRELWSSYGPRNEFLEYQAKVLTAALLKKEESVELPIPVFHIKKEDFLLFAVGQVTERRGVKSVFKFDAQEGRFVRLFEKEGRLIGVITLNVAVDPEQVVGRIRDNASVNSFQEWLLPSTAAEVISSQDVLINEVADHSAVEDAGNALEQTNSA